MQSMFEKADFAAEAGSPAFDWSGIDIIDGEAPHRGIGWRRVPVSALCILISGLLSEGVVFQCV